jgi:hypothetical protein
MATPFTPPPPDVPFNQQMSGTLGEGTTPPSPDMVEPYNIFEDDAALLKVFEKMKQECLESRWIWEREWLRDLYYVMGRQWIMYHPTKREWVDKRLHKWIPRPVTNKMAETLQAIRTTFGSIDLTVKVQPIGNDTKSIAAAEVADQMAPLIHEEHLMGQVMREADFWLISSGSVMLQLSWDRDKRFNRGYIQHDQCLGCGYTAAPKDIVDGGNTCPQCGSSEFAPATDEAGNPIGEEISFGRGKTTALSPFEYAFPAYITRFDELPYILRLRWREKSYFEANFPELVHKLTWEKGPTDRSLQLFKSLALTNDVGIGASVNSLGTSGSPNAEGVTEYELWVKPTTDFPMGAIIRVIGDRSPLILRVPDQNVPGPCPYKDLEGKVIFPFCFAQYEHVGGRLYGRSALTPLIQKQDQLNQLDSLIQLITQRMANPIWVIPEGAGIDEFSGEPGFVLKWNPLQVGGGNAKPERIAGSEVPQSLGALREQILSDIENLSGTYDIIKGQKPAGVEAFSALQLLVERSQSRFQSVFASRGEMYRRWFEIAIELERQFGPDERVMTVIGPNQSYMFEHFLNSQLQGQVTVKIEDGSNMPKTALGKRAAIEQANQLGLINPMDPDQKYNLLLQYGLQDLSPSLNVHVQSALRMQDEFEQWMNSPEAAMAQPVPTIDPMTGAQMLMPPVSPLEVKPWMDYQIHWSERIKWCNTDKMRDAMKQNPMIEQIVTQHLNELQMMLMPPPPPDMGPDGAPGQGQSLANSNRNSNSTANVPNGNGQGAQKQGPV